MGAPIQLLSIKCTNRDTMKPRTAAIAWLALLLSRPPAAPAVGPYYVTDLGLLPGGPAVDAYDLNNFGQVVGVSRGTVQHAFLWTPAKINGTSGSIGDLGDLPGGTDTSSANSINSYGQVVGWSDSQEYGSGETAFLWNPTEANGTSGSMVNLGGLSPNYGLSDARAINSIGQVVGIGDESFNRFQWTPTSANGSTGSMIDLATGGFDGTGNANGINSYGQIVGGGVYSFSGALLWTPVTPNGGVGSMADLGPLSPTLQQGDATDINDYGQVVGSYYIPLPGDYTVHGFLWTPSTPNGMTGALVDLGNSVGGLFLAWGINSQGYVVGLRNDGFAGVWVPDSANISTGTTYNLNSLLDPVSGKGWVVTQARAINDFGQIVGYGFFDPDGPGGSPRAQRAFLLTPIPEPTALFLLTCAAIVISSNASHIRRKRT